MPKEGRKGGRRQAPECAALAARHLKDIGRRNAARPDAADTLRTLGTRTSNLRRPAERLRTPLGN